ncbi:MAG: hypothetical protein DHS20C03_39730 [Minwuia thermotolerans]|nr:MAG: hypothetical protein DHS20C03_39730 [Minwuia thermotolerans]
MAAIQGTGRGPFGLDLHVRTVCGTLLGRRNGRQRQTRDEGKLCKSDPGTWVFHP